MLLNLSYYRVFGGRLQRRKVTLKNDEISVTFDYASLRRFSIVTFL
jgi:hypothetical protein